MLQYSVQLPPLSLSSSKPKHRTMNPSKHMPSSPASAVSSSSASPSPSASAAPTPKRNLDKRSPVFAHSTLPLSISTVFNAPSSPSLPSSSLSSHSPSLPPTPSLPTAYPFPATAAVQGSKLSGQVHRSPYLNAATLPVSVPGTRSPHPLKSIPLPSSGLPSPNIGGRSTLGGSGSSSFSSSVLDVLSKGDLIGEGLELQGEVVRRVPISPLPSPEEGVAVAAPESEEPAKTFEVVRRLGTGSYAVVYLVREVLRLESFTSSRTDVDDGRDLDMSMDGHSFEDQIEPENAYGKEYAIKLLSKANLDDEALTAQMFEAHIHLSLPAHPNIVTLHRVLDTPHFLLLLLEFVPGEDLFYFLEQARDHYEPSPLNPSTSPSESISSIESSRTPPTPSLLSTLSPGKLLSRNRLKLIASMFSQMCDAVATCHERGVFHRDIKPENFIVTDGVAEVKERGADGQEVVRRERKVVVKLTDFGLSTTDLHSADMDCGSAPYMSFECRNNLHPTYMPRPADVWSLGIVLINMLYHYNPWTDTTEGVCPSFSLYRQNPMHFFLSRFSGMTPAVAEFLTTRVFCILPNAEDDSTRVSARQFGVWIRDLPDLLAPKLVSRPGSSGLHTRSSSFTVNIADVQGHRLASIPHSRRPSLRSSAGSRNPSLMASQRVTSAMLSRAPSLGPAPEEQENMYARFPASSGVGLGVLASVLDQEIEEQDAENENENEPDSAPGSRSTSHTKRRKRGARKGKGAAAATSPVPTATQQDQTLEVLASASQALAREISRTSRSNSIVSSVTSPLTPATSNLYIPPAPTTKPPLPPLPPVPPVPVVAPASPTITKKPSKWKLGFGKSSSNSGSGSANKEPSSTASNVANLLMGLDPPSANKSLATPRQQQFSPYLQQHAAPSSSSFAPSSRYAPSHNSSMISLDEPQQTASAAASARGRRYQTGRAAAAANDVSVGMWGASTVSAFANDGSGGAHVASSSSSLSSSRAVPAASSSSLLHPSSALNRQQRGASPASASQVSVMSASTASSNWRSSMASSSSAATSSSAFTRYSNSSARSVSTTATSVSNASWRSANKPTSHVVHANGQTIRLPSNVKFVDGEPWELSELPRQMYPDPENVTFSPPPQQRKRAQKPKNTSSLDTISERPAYPLSARTDASTSTTELSGAGSAEGDDCVGSPRKVQKGQINALAKMLSALRR